MLTTRVFAGFYLDFSKMDIKNVQNRFSEFQFIAKIINFSLSSFGKK